MKIVERFVYIIAIVLLVIYSVQKPKKSIEYKTIQGDTIYTVNVITKDSLIPKYITIYNTDTLWMHDTAFLPTDTNAILADYIRMISYDSIMLKNDSSMTAWVDVKVTQNRLYNIDFYSLNNRKSVIVNNYNNGLSVGLTAGKDIISPIVSYQINKHDIGIGYNLSNNGIFVQYKYKINNGIFK